jgi:hypothetical protein
VRPFGAIVLYEQRSLEKPATLPRGLVMIAGNATARRPQPTRIVAWSCGDVGDGPGFSRVPACGADEMLRLKVTFPSCWNGRTTDSRNHKRHMRYPSGGRCPASHPVALPALVFTVLYPSVPFGAQVATGHYGVHADFMNGWNDDVRTRIAEDGS